MVKEKGICKYDGCNKEAFTRGYCGAHYQRLRKSGVLQMRECQRNCKVENCQKYATIRGYCEGHYQAAIRDGVIHPTRVDGIRKSDFTIHRCYVCGKDLDTRDRRVSFSTVTTCEGSCKEKAFQVILAYKSALATCSLATQLGISRNMVNHIRRKMHYKRLTDFIDVVEHPSINCFKRLYK